MVIIPHHANPLEMVEAAVGVVDAAWTAIERHRDHVHHDAAASTWEDCVKLERELIHERSENQRLKVALEELREALHEVRNVNFADHQPTSTHEDGCPLDLCERLQKKVDSLAFLERLQDMQEAELKEASNIPLKEVGTNTNSEEFSSWVMVPDQLYDAEVKEEIAGLDDVDGFVLVGRDDVIESLAAFVAQLVVCNPKAKFMTPTQMQEVISMSFATMEEKGKLRKLWNIAKVVYSSVTWTTTVATTVVGLYTNPFIVKALFKVLIISSRLMVKALI